MWQENLPTGLVALAQGRALGAQALPARVLDLDPGALAFVHEQDLDLGRVRPVLAEMPAVAETVGWIPAADLAPVVLGAVGSTLEDPATDPGLQDDVHIGRS